MKVLLLIFINFLTFISMAQTENQKYIVTNKINDIEIREYLPAIYASVTLEENNAKQNNLNGNNNVNSISYKIKKIHNIGKFILI